MIINRNKKSKTQYSRLTSGIPSWARLPFLFLGLLATGCGKEDNPPIPSEPELISTVRMVFTPEQGSPLRFDYRVLDGVMEVDTVRLAAHQDYDWEVHFLNEYAQPVEDLTDEILEEGRDHLVLRHSLPSQAMEWESGNTDEGGEPLNQRSKVRTGPAGEAKLRILLLHRPTNKFGTDLSQAGGETDAEALFPLILHP